MKLLQDRHIFFLELLLEHIKISFLSIWLAIIIGLFLGIFISKYEKTSKVVLNLVNFIYTIPSISLLGFLIPLSGIGNTTAVIALTVYALLPMVRNTHTGIITINPAIIEAARGMGSTESQILWKIKLPLALPTIMSGIRKTILENFNLTVDKGDFLTIIGSSGSGKTTILKMINGLILPTEGSIFVNGKNILQEDMIQLRRNIGYAIQGSVLFPHMSVRENIAYVPKLWNKNDNLKTEAAINKWMKIIGLDPEYLDRYPR
jgi:osmoprotectant transport system permease protein